MTNEKSVHLMILTDPEFHFIKNVLHKHYQDTMAESRKQFLEKKKKVSLPRCKFYLILDEEDQKGPLYNYNRIVPLEGMKHINEEGEVEWMLELTNHEMKYLIDAASNPPIFSRYVKKRK